VWLSAAGNDLHLVAVGQIGGPLEKGLVGVLDDYSQPSAAQTWYYCSDPEGYNPYVAQCNTAWQPVPAS